MGRCEMDRERKRDVSVAMMLVDKVEYDREFIDDVMREFPAWKELHEAVKGGRLYAVGEMVEKTRNFDMTARQIVDCFEAGKEKEVKSAAIRSERRQDLYARWYRVWETHKEKCGQNARI